MIKIKLIILAIMTLTVGAYSQSAYDKRDYHNTSTDTIFPKGSKISSQNFTGTVWLHTMANADSIFNTSIGNVTFEPGARTNWHYHPGGQILLVTNGKGFYQEKGKHIRTIQKGDIVKCLPNVIHWHGATNTDTLVHIAINTNTDKGSVVWLGNVSEEDYFLKPQ